VSYYKGMRVRILSTVVLRVPTIGEMLIERGSGERNLFRESLHSYRGNEGLATMLFLKEINRGIGKRGEVPGSEREGKEVRDGKKKERSRVSTIHGLVKAEEKSSTIFSYGARKDEKGKGLRKKARSLCPSGGENAYLLLRKKKELLSLHRGAERGGESRDHAGESDDLQGGKTTNG